MNLDLRLELVPYADRNRHRTNTALPCFLGCQPVQGAVRTVFVDPGSEIIEPASDPSPRQARRHQSPPNAKCPECPFDLAVQIRSSDAGLDRDDAQLLHGGPELPPELRAMKGRDDSGSFHTTPDRRNSWHRRKFQMLNGPVHDSLGHNSLVHVQEPAMAPRAHSAALARRSTHKLRTRPGRLSRPTFSPR